MHGLLRLPMGGIYWVGRWALLVYKWVWSGALCMAAVYTLTAWLADRAMRLPHQWDGIGFVLPVAQLGWIMWRGVNLYYKKRAVAVHHNSPCSAGRSGCAGSCELADYTQAG